VVQDEADFRRQIVRVMQSGTRSGGANLSGIEMDFYAYLGGRDAIDESSLKVRRTGRAEALLAVDCAAASGVSVQEASRAVRAAWVEDLRYAEFEAHHLALTENVAVLRFVTQMGPGGLYVTGEVRIRASEG
jgi:hypothetical protein